MLLTAELLAGDIKLGGESLLGNGGSHREGLRKRAGAENGRYGANGGKEYGERRGGSGDRVSQNKFVPLIYATLAYRYFFGTPHFNFFLGFLIKL
jgi:hypothetical protein